MSRTVQQRFDDAVKAIASGLAELEALSREAKAEADGECAHPSDQQTDVTTMGCAGHRFLCGRCGLEYSEDDDGEEART